LEDQGVDGRMVSKWTLGRLVGGVWSGFTWLKIGIVGGLLWMRWWTFGFWRRGVSWLVSRHSSRLLVYSFVRCQTKPPLFRELASAPSLKRAPLGAVTKYDGMMKRWLAGIPTTTRKGVLQSISHTMNFTYVSNILLCWILDALP
jgi:hypothetical protein